MWRGAWISLPQFVMCRIDVFPRVYGLANPVIPYENCVSIFVPRTTCKSGREGRAEI
jgi:hypothetical protein